MVPFNCYSLKKWKIAEIISQLEAEDVFISYNKVLKSLFFHSLGFQYKILDTKSVAHGRRTERHVTHVLCGALKISDREL